MNDMINTRSNFHLGVYGIIINNNSILLITKKRGPYTGKLDLPGGKPEHGETPEQTLVREVFEETGVKVISEKFFAHYSILVQHTIDDANQENLHHLGIIYLINSYDHTMLTKEMDNEDSLGANWYKINTLTEDKLSPLAFKAVVDIKKQSF